TNWTQAIKYLSVAVTRPGLYFSTLLRDKLEEKGVTFSGRTVQEEVKTGSLSLLDEIKSKPLSEILRVMNRLSNNVTAENLCKVMGAETYGSPGTREKGVKAMTDALVELGFEKGSFKLEDASGLSNLNRITANQVVTILKKIHERPDLRDVVLG